MLEQWAEHLAEIMQSNIWLAPLAALLGGLLTAANPCVLAAAPLMVGYVAGQENKSVTRSFLLSLMFTLGLTITFLLLWLGIRAASLVFPAHWWKYIAALVCLLLGLHLIGVLNVRIPRPPGWQPKRRGFVGAILLGLLFGLISLPCVGPVLGVLLAISPMTNFGFGLLLLVAYSLGHCGLVLIGGTSMGLVQRVIDSKHWTGGTAVLRRIAGVMIVGVAVWLVFFD
jgi:cytochrome c-type biogenesis protein